MNEASKKVKNKLYEQKKIYLSVIITIILGILLGIIYNLILSKSDHTLIANQYLLIKKEHLYLID